jgi:hypothetical protein
MGNSNSSTNIVVTGTIDHKHQATIAQKDGGFIVACSTKRGKVQRIVVNSNTQICYSNDKKHRGGIDSMMCHVLDKDTPQLKAECIRVNDEIVATRVDIEGNPSNPDRYFSGMRQPF